MAASVLESIGITEEVFSDWYAEEIKRLKARKAEAEQVLVAKTR